MSRKVLLFAFLLTSTLCVGVYSANAPTKKRLTDIKAITLHAGKHCTGRRSAAQQQLQCQGHLCQYAPDTVQCKNMGTDGMDVQWSCEADLPTTLSFKDSDVNCEGWDWPNDPYVLVGSCTLSYSLKGRLPSNGQNDAMAPTPYKKPLNGIPFFPFFTCLIVLILCFSRCNNRPTQVSRFAPRGTGVSNFATGVATGAATTYALAGNRRRWGG